MNKFFALLFFCSLNLITFAQNYSSVEDSDPEAKAILDKIKKQQESYQSVEAAFTLNIEIPEQPKEVQKGLIAQQGDKYNLQLGSHSVISDGTAIWMILHNNKEVQINDIPDEEDESILTPQSLFSIYEKGNFVYILANEFHDKSIGKNVQQIEFKPIDKDSEYTKLRLTVEKGTTNVQNIKAFSRDGSRYTFTFNKISPNKTFTASHFSFDKTKFKDYYVEDLRE